MPLDNGTQSRLFYFERQKKRFHDVLIHELGCKIEWNQ